MLIEISQLPDAIQQQILMVQQGEIVQFAKDGQIIGALSNDSITATAGLWARYGVDGLEYEQQIRSEWDRPWEK